MFTKPIKKALSRLYENPNNDAAIKVLRSTLRSTLTDAEEVALLRAWGKAERKTAPYSRQYHSVPGMINAWEQKQDSDWESWKVVFILEGNDVEKAEIDMYRAGYAVHGYNGYHAGQAFANPMYFSQVTPNRILVTQRGGLDV